MPSERDTENRTIEVNIQKLNNIKMKPPVFVIRQNLETRRLHLPM